MSRFRWIYGTAFIVSLLLLAEAAVRMNLVSPYVAPAPSTVLVTLYELIVSGDVLGPLGHTLFLLVVGYLLASVAGISSNRKAA